MPPYFSDCTCPANNGINRIAVFFIGFLGLGAVLITSALRSVETRGLPVNDSGAFAPTQAQAQQRRIKVLEDQVDRAFNAVMAMIVLMLATVLTVLLSHGVPPEGDRSEL